MTHGRSSVTVFFSSLFLTSPPHCHQDGLVMGDGAEIHVLLGDGGLQAPCMSMMVLMGDGGLRDDLDGWWWGVYFLLR